MKRPRRKVLLPISLAALLLVVAQVVLAAPPTGTFEISDNTPTTGQVVTFTPQNINDPDGGATSVSFDYGDGTPTDSIPPFTHAYGSATPAQKTVTMTITAQPGPSEDPASPPETTTVTRTVTVSPANQNPTASFGWSRVNAPPTPNNGNQPYVGQTVQFTSTASDPDGDDITYDWNFGDGQSSTAQNPTHSYGSAGGKQVTLTVRDNRGGSVTTPAQTVTVNTLPIANGSVLNGQSSGQPDQKYNHPIVGQSFVLTPQALQAIPGPNGQGAQPGSSDAEDGTNLKSYSWDLNNDNVYETPGQTGSGSGRGSVVVTTPALLTAGAKTVGLRVTDSRDATATNKVNFRVNSIPVAGFTNDPITPVIGDTIRLFSTSTDPDGTSDPLTYAWDLDNDGAFDDSTSPTPTVPAGSTAGTKTIKLRVTDSGGLRNDSTRTIEVQQSIPKGSFQWSPASPLPGQAVTFTNSSSPSAANRQITNVEWDFDWNGTTFTTDAVGATANHAFDSPGTKSVAMKVTEAGSTGGGFAIVFDRIVVNAPPQAAFTVAPGSPFTGDVVTYSSTSVDTDGPLVLHEWDLDGDGAFDDATGPVVSASYKKSGGYNVGLRVTDSRGATATAARMVNVQARPLALLSGVLVEIRGQLEGRLTRITRLLVRAPRGTKVTVRCQGGSCSKAKVVKRKGKGRKKLRIKKFERLLKPRTTIIVTITKPGFLGKRTTIKMRAGKSPLRTDLCLVPGAKRATECPEP